MLVLLVDLRGKGTERRFLFHQTIYGILGVPHEDLEYLTQQAAVRGNGSATATESSKANQCVSVPPSTHLVAR